MPVVQLAHAAREHDPLQVLAALAVWDALRKGAREARDHRLAELDLMRRSRCPSRWSAALAHSESPPMAARTRGWSARPPSSPPCSPSSSHSSPARRRYARARLRAGEGRHAQGVVVRLGGQQDGRHELTHALGGQAGTLGLEGGGLKADESSLKVITMITRRSSLSVSCMMDIQ